MSDAKTIRTYTSLIEAESARSYLEAHQIEATLPDRHALYHQPHLIDILGGVRLQVRVEQSETADQLLQEVEKRSHLSAVDSVQDHDDNFLEARKRKSLKWFTKFIALAILLYWGFQWMQK
jgi:hypothetical protein